MCTLNAPRGWLHFTTISCSLFSLKAERRKSSPVAVTRPLPTSRPLPPRELSGEELPNEVLLFVFVWKGTDLPFTLSRLRVMPLDLVLCGPSPVSVFPSPSFQQQGARAVRPLGSVAPCLEGGVNV